MAAIISSIKDRLNVQTKIAIARTMLHPEFQIRDVSNLDRYYAYYETELRMLDFGKFLQTSLSWNRGTIKHDDILSTAQRLKNSGNLTKRECREQLAAQISNVDGAELNKFIDLSLRLWSLSRGSLTLIIIQKPQTPVLT